MANSRSARKRIRVNERKRIRNRDARSAVRTKVTKARRVLLSGETVNVEEELRAAIRALDRASEKGILHRNNAARRKSRLTAMAAKIMRAPEGSDEALEARATAAGGQKGRTMVKTGAKGAAKSKPGAKAPATKARVTTKAKAKPAGAAATATTTRAKTAAD